MVDFEDWMVNQAQPDGITISLGDAEWGPDSAALQSNPQVRYSMATHIKTLEEC